MPDLYLVHEKQNIIDIEKVPFSNETRDIEDFILQIQIPANSGGGSGTKFLEENN